NCATCDSRTISCAPFLISLSSSGKRKESVSRESSVHSMMSMNCFLMKSRMAIGPPQGSDSIFALVVSIRSVKPAWRHKKSSLTLFGRARDLLRFRVSLGELLFDLRGRQRAGDDRAVGKDQRRCRVDLQPGAKRLRLRDGVAAIALVVRHLARNEDLVPRLGLVRRAPDLLR